MQVRRHMPIVMAITTILIIYKDDDPILKIMTMDTYISSED